MEGLRCVWRGFDLEGFSFFSKKMETPTQKIFFFKMAYGRHIYMYIISKILRQEEILYFLREMSLRKP